MTQEDASVEVVADPWHPQNRAREFGDALTEKEARGDRRRGGVAGRGDRHHRRGQGRGGPDRGAGALAGGHLLIEDIPGVGKTMLAKSLAAALGAERHRIQFTPDLLPGDVTGASVFNQATSEFEFRRGAVFTQILLADEINRASPKTQSALLEAMEERQVSVDGTTYPLAEPFMVVATANPVEMEGTYRLPEAQRDRFLAQTTMGYPVPAAEARMLAAQAGPVREGDHDLLDTVAERTTPERIAAHVRAVLISCLPHDPGLRGPPRGSHAIPPAGHPRCLAPRRRAPGARREGQRRAGACTFVTPQDIADVIMPVWRHRMHLTPQALGAARARASSSIRCCGSTASTCTRARAMFLRPTGRGIAVLVGTLLLWVLGDLARAMPLRHAAAAGC